MTEETRQRISALLDNDLTSNQASDLLDQLESDSDLRGEWERYHLIGELIRGEPINLSARGISDRVQHSLRDEPTILVPGVKRMGRRIVRHWQTPLAGAAIAAGVAVLTVIALPQLKPAADPGGGGTQIARQMVSAPRIEPTFVSANEPNWKSLSEPEMQSRLNRYLIDHSEYASSRGMKGVLPYASFVTYDRGRQ